MRQFAPLLLAASVEGIKVFENGEFGPDSTMPPTITIDGGMGVLPPPSQLWVDQDGYAYVDVFDMATGDLIHEGV